MTTTRVGFGFDVHRFSDDPERRLIIGGVHFQGEPGLIGHSDADVLVHAVVDALLGAAGLGDIGEHFSDRDTRWKGADSAMFLQEAVRMLGAEGWIIHNVDCTVVAERPKISPRRSELREAMERLVGAPVSIKASRAEGLGALGRVEGAACYAVAMVSKDGEGGER